MKNQKGFSLIELLVVVIIIAIIAAIAIPSLLSSRRAAAEANGLASLRTVNSAEQTYYATSANDFGLYEDLTGAGLLDTGFPDGGGVRGAYTFSEIDLGAGSDGFCAVATPLDTASKTFYVSHRNQVYFNSTDCDPDTGAMTGGTAVGNDAP